MSTNRTKEDDHLCTMPVDWTDGGKKASLLFQFGAEINLPHQGKATPIFEAIIHNRWPRARILVNAGANLHAANKDGVTPMELANSCSITSDISTLRIGLDNTHPTLRMTLLQPMESRAGIEAFVTSHQSPQPANKAGVDLLKAYGARSVSFQLMGDVDSKSNLLKVGEKYTDAVEYQPAY